MNWLWPPAVGQSGDGGQRVEALRRPPLEAGHEQGVARGAGAACRARVARAATGLRRATARCADADDGPADGEAGQREEPTTAGVPRPPVGAAAGHLRRWPVVVRVVHTSLSSDVCCQQPM